VDRALHGHRLIAVTHAGGPDLAAEVRAHDDLDRDAAVAGRLDLPQSLADLRVTQEAAQRPAAGLGAAVRLIRMLRARRRRADGQQRRQRTSASAAIDARDRALEPRRRQP